VEDGVVRGIRGQSRDGRIVEERASIVIGTDGRNSLVASSVEAPEYRARPSLTCGYYSYWSGVPMQGVEIYPREGRGVVAEITNDGLVYIAAGFAHSEFAAVRADIEGHVLRAIAECAPALWERMQGARREAPFRGTSDFRFFFRKPYGPGWALVGDAGYHRDAITGQGITDAFRDADLVAQAVDAWLGGADAMDSAMANYEHCRNQSVMPMYEFTYDLARLAPPTVEQQQLFGALHGNQPDTDRFLGLIAGTTSIPEFTSEANIGRIISEATPRAA
jgi:flavin-dependent dehydrogenase